jgi:hypothetical protein
MPVPNTFANATATIPLSQLDANFATTITLGNTAIQLGNTVTTLNNMTLANVTISTGNVTVTNATVTTANVTTANITNLIVSGTGTFAAGSNTAPSITFSGDTNTGIFSPAADTVAIGTNGTEALRVNSSQNVGIGATSTNGKLTIKNPSVTGEQTLWNIQAATTTTNIGSVTYNQDTDAMKLLNNSNFSGATLQLGVNGTDLTIDAPGNLGLGVTPSAWSAGKAIEVGFAGNGIWGFTAADIYTTSNVYYDGGWKYASNNAVGVGVYEIYGATHYWYRAAAGTAGAAATLTSSMVLDSSGNLTINNGNLNIENTGGLIPQINFGSSNASIEFVNRNSGGAKTFKWYYGASGSGTPATLSTSGVWTNASDIRGKENIADIHYGLSEVLALKSRQYDVKSDNSHAIGFVAQEVLSIIPEIVHGSEEDFYGLDYGSLSAVLVKAIQELKAELDATKAEVALLKGAK